MMSINTPQPPGEDRQELLELYKLHAELADRASQRREGANRLFVALLTGIFVFFGTMVRSGAGGLPIWPILLIGSAFGMALCVAWYILIRSYRQLNTGKFKALHELEQRLTYPFFTREWELLKQGKDFHRYWQLTVVENFLPVIFLVLFVFLAWFAFSQGKLG